MRKIAQNFIIVLSFVAFVIASIPLDTTTARALGTPSTAGSGAACDQQFYSNNDILFYSTCATSCSSSGNAGNGNIDKVRGANNGDKIFNFWVDAGLSPQQAAGITGSMQSESGFSPFRHEDGKRKDGTPIPFGEAGWGIAQFTGGQRTDATASVQAVVGADLFNQYYKQDYGSSVFESAGFVPKGVPVDVNDKFLLGELNYLLTYIKAYVPNGIRTSGLKNDFSQSVPSNTKLYDYLKTVTQAGEAAAAWTYLYEQPGDIKNTTIGRQSNATKILTLKSTGASTTAACGGNLTQGGMTLAQGIKFMNDYKNTPSNVQYIAGAGTDCAGGPLSNCVSFSVFFARKYTNLKVSGAAGNGSTVVAHLLSNNPTAQTGHSPRPDAIFSTASGSQQCGDVKCGHTGVILGVDTVKGVVVVGEAACSAPADWDTAREYPLSKFDSAAYTYIYTDNLLKGVVQ